jgi:hypothetical protein
LIKLFNKKDREQYLDSKIENTGAYFLVKYENVTELLWFAQYKNFNEDGSDWYLESPCSLKRVELTNVEDEFYYLNIGYIVKEDGYAYEVDSPQVAPFLPEEIDIEYVSDKERDAVDWLLKSVGY